MELGLNLKKMWDEFSLKATISKTILITKIYNKLKKERYVECSASFLVRAPWARSNGCKSRTHLGNEEVYS
mgnify:CR=1 FL=1